MVGLARECCLSVQVLHSEDLNHGQVYEGVQVRTRSRPNRNHSQRVKKMPFRAQMLGVSA